MSALSVPLPKLPGVDVSAYQGHIDWPVLAPHIRFAFIKVTEGAHFVDAHAVENIKGATDNGVPFGLYHFFRNGGSEESDKFLEVFTKYPSHLPPVLDIETPPLTGVRDLLVPNALSFLRAVGSHACPLVYTSPSFASLYLTPYFAQYPLWIAHYTHAAQPTLAIWSNWDFWQYSGDGKLPGVENDIDLNWCRDEPTLDSLMRLPT